MYINITGSKDNKGVYITQSYRRENGKTSSRIYKKLGSTMIFLTQFSGNEAEMMDWAQKEKVTVSFSPLACIPLDEERLFNVGYLFLQQLCTELRLDNICRNILYLPSGKPAVGEETGGRIRLQRNLKNPSGHEYDPAFQRQWLHSLLQTYKTDRCIAQCFWIQNGL